MFTASSADRSPVKILDSDSNHGNWTRIALEDGPPPRVWAGMNYDPESERVILFGGWPALNDVWAYDFLNDTWTHMAPESPPSPRYSCGFAYDSESDRIILFGGAMSVAHFDDTWAYDFNANSWTKMNPEVSPSPRHVYSMVYDSESDRVILFGGDHPFLSDTWAYDYNANTWVEMERLVSPGGRIFSAMAYDSESDRIILFGGLTADSTGNNETWAYDYDSNTWAEMTPIGSPPPRSGSFMVYDSRSDRIIMFGGYLEGGPRASDTWAYDYNSNTWGEIVAVYHPPARNHHQMAYSETADLVILFGGYSGIALGDTWTFRYPPSPPGSPQDLKAIPRDREVFLSWQPPAFDGGSVLTGYAIYRGMDAGNLTPIVVWGTDTEYTDRGLENGVDYFYAVSARNEIGEGSLSAEATARPGGPPSQVRDLEASAGDGIVELTWKVPLHEGGMPISNYTIYRGTVSGDLGVLQVLGDVLDYLDTSVVPGITYFYQISALNAYGEGLPSEEVSVALLDFTIPEIAITSPQNLSTLTDVSITVTGTASDNVAVQRVEISLNGVDWIVASGTTTWSADISLAGDTSIIYARAVDTSGNVGATSIQVTVDISPYPDQMQNWPLVVGVSAGVAGAGATVALLVWRRLRRGGG